MNPGSWLISGTKLSSTRRPASPGLVTPSYRRTVAYIARLLQSVGTPRLTCPARAGELRTARTGVAGRVRCRRWFGPAEFARCYHPQVTLASHYLGDRPLHRPAVVQEGHDLPLEVP